MVHAFENDPVESMRLESGSSDSKGLGRLRRLPNDENPLLLRRRRVRDSGNTDAPFLAKRQASPYVTNTDNLRDCSCNDCGAPERVRFRDEAPHRGGECGARTTLWHSSVKLNCYEMALWQIAQGGNRTVRHPLNKWSIQRVRYSRYRAFSD